MLMKRQGAALVDPADIETLGEFDESEFTVLLYELKADLNAYLARLGPGAPVHSLKEIIEYNERNKEKEMPYFGQENFMKSEAKGPLTSQEYLDALDKCRRLSRKDGIDAVMDKLKLDALVAPTEGPAWVTDLVNGDHFIGSSSTAAAVAGYPSITVPAGLVFGLPVGISFFGRAWSEPLLINWPMHLNRRQNAGNRRASCRRPTCASSPKKKEVCKCQRNCPSDGDGLKPCIFIVSWVRGLPA